MLTQLLGLPEHPLTTFAGLMLGGLGLYFAFSSLSYWYFFKFRKDRYHPSYEPDKKENGRAIRWSVLSIVGNAILTTPFHLAIAYGYSKVYYDPFEHGIGWLLISAVIYLAVTETAIYWIHRALHWGPLYDYIHEPHHSFKVPNSLAGVAFNPLDSFAQALPHHLCVFFIPVHVGVYLAFVTFVTMWAVMIHDRVSFVRWPGINFTGHHTLHHWYADYNYGQFFTLWDRIGGTYLNPDSDEVQADVPDGNPASVTRVLALAGALVLMVCSTARADREICTETPSDAEVRQRLAVVEQHVREEEPSVRRWFSGFALLHGVMASGAGLLAGFSVDDEGFRNEMLVGTTSSTLALLSIVVTLPPLLGAGDQIGSYRQDTPAQRLARLRAAEDLLQRGAKAVDFIQSWFPITLTSLYSAAASVFNLVALERTRGAFTHAIGGAVIGLGRVLLRPMGARDRWRRYQQQYPDAGCRVAPEAAGPQLRVFAAGAGLGLRIDF